VGTAATVIGQAKQLASGFDGPRWSPLQEDHRKWCVALGDDYRTAAGVETDARATGLLDCRKNIAAAAAAGFNNRRPFGKQAHPSWRAPGPRGCADLGSASESLCHPFSEVARPGGTPCGRKDAMILNPTSEERNVGLLRRAVLRCRLPVGVVALIGLLLALAVHVAAIFGVDSESMWPRVWLLHSATFPLGLLAMLTGWALSSGRQSGLRGYIAVLPVPVRLLIGLALIYAAANMLALAPASGAGEPIIRDGHFFFNNHGAVRGVTEEQFHLQRAVTLRLYSAVWVYLYFLIVAFLLAARRRTR
jgi:hypothetical protein